MVVQSSSRFVRKSCTPLLKRLHSDIQSSNLSYRSFSRSRRSRPIHNLARNFALKSGQSSFLARRLFCSSKQSSSSASSGFTRYNPTRNPHLDPFWRRFGLNAHPGKISCCGLLGGFFGALCGVGGGVVMIPLMRLITTMTAHQIAGTSLVAVTVGAMVGGLSYLQSGVARLPIAISMAVAAMMFSSLGAFASSRISSVALTRVTALCLASSVPFIWYKADPSMEAPNLGAALDDASVEATLNDAMQIIAKHQEEEKLWRDDPLRWYQQNYKYCLIGCVSGFLSGLIGIGGGVVTTSFMASATDLTQHEAVATSLLAMIPAALVGSMTHYRLRHISAPVALILAGSCAVGMLASSKFALERPDWQLRYIFCIVLAASALRMAVL